ncbi:SRPBCC family protein [Winogradskyella arenosi]|uniref:Polyketide cyclase/dehydrase/lipid transport protein n=1 Tax=Winogradskyella arenosi TaxID=533325 RepID=A0A368ZF34_9FLAO|nr:SRPBCC family protein [Winogradskyella arenosi]RCW91215.1 hypothetical protein DFQ08_10339 [Winogradskyella arenosi]
MQYSTEILIEKPISEVLKKLNTIDNLKHWQHGLVSTSHISGVPNQLGAKIKLKYNFGRCKMEVLETVTKQNLPSELHATYTTKGVRNIQENYFKVTEDNATLWISKNEFQPTSLKMSLCLFFMPGAFKKQTKTLMSNFKNYLEKGVSVHQPN